MSETLLKQAQTAQEKGAKSNNNNNYYLFSPLKKRTIKYIPPLKGSVFADPNANVTIL
jgi:hypothetical protein